MDGITNPILTSLIDEDNKTLTENGALTNKSTLNDLLDFFASGGSMRERSEDDIVKVFQNAFAYDKRSALRLLFYFRDCRGGQGERRLFRTIIKWLANYHSEYLIKNLDIIPFFGRWDDLFVLFDTKCEEQMMDFVAEQIRKDSDDYMECRSISLLSKWMPSINTSCKKTVYYAKKFLKKLNISEKEYRKFLSKLRRYSNVVEKQMCLNEWTSIEYPKVPSLASLRYTNAFKKHDNVRYSKYIEDLIKGKTKINAKTLYPYDIVRKIFNNRHRDMSEDEINVLDSQWKSLPNYYPEDSDKNILVVCDISGSMYDGIPNISVSVSLAIYCAEKMKGGFKDHFITFSREPSIVKIKGSNIYEKTLNVLNRTEGYNTDIIAVFRMLLNNILSIQEKTGRKLSDKELPSHIMIVSDMEFDQNYYNSRLRYIENFDDALNVMEEFVTKTTYQDIKNMYKEAHIPLPKIIWWNVGGRKSTFPITKTDSGHILISGCSPSILTSIFSNEDFNPESFMFDVINNKRYDVVKV